MKLFAVTGNPILFSKSPLLFNFAFTENNLSDHIYTRIAANSAREALELATELNLSGFNITAPFKEDFFTLATQKSPEALATGVVNTFIRTKPKDTLSDTICWYGHNTDPFGVLTALSKKINLSKKSNLSAVILGNGGAARACRHALDSIQIPSQCIARTNKFNALEFTDPKAKDLFSKSLIIISTIPPSVSLPSGYSFHKEAVFLDATYSTESEISNIAKKSNITIASGLDWLIGQAVKNYSLFTESILNDRQTKSLETHLYSYQKKRGSSTYIIGLMGSGKSSVLKELASLGFSTFDTDQEIVTTTKMSINEIFATKGENYFRKLEAEVLRSAKADFISCGGGIVLSEENRKYIKSNGTSFWLWSSLDILTSRLSQTSDRPLLKGKSVKEALTILLEERFKHYSETSDIIIRSDRRSSKELAEKILYEINSTR